MKTAEIKVDYVGSFGNDLSVVNAARVSFEKESDWEKEFVDHNSNFISGTLKDGDVKLINYLAKHKHFSPFNHAFLSFRIKAPIFVARQLVKHKFLPWNEVSRRYVDSEPEFFFPDMYRAKADNVKQGSATIRAEKMYIEEEVEGWGTTPSPSFFVEQTIQDCLYTYNAMLKADVCAEQARMVLPLNTMTEWIWSGTLGAFLDMLVLRLDPHTQYESRVVAQYIAEHIKELFPISYKARIEQ